LALGIAKKYGHFRIFHKVVKRTGGLMNWSKYLLSYKNLPNNCVLKESYLLRISFPILLFWSCLYLLSCNGLYNAGNRVTLDYTIDTKLSQTIIKMYVDSMLTNGRYKVPPKWQHHDKLIDIDPENSRNIYFSDSPEEMYLIQFNGVLLLADVYNPQIVDGDYISVPERMPEGGKERVLKRFQTVILNQIESMAKRDGCPDSVLYYEPRFINGNWTDEPKWSPKKDTLEK
jgi:hypothetical protein